MNFILKTIQIGISIFIFRFNLGRGNVLFNKLSPKNFWNRWKCDTKANTIKFAIFGNFIFVRGMMFEKVVSCAANTHKSKLEIVVFVNTKIICQYIFIFRSKIQFPRSDQQ